jgi:hypothetical protein
VPRSRPAELAKAPGPAVPSNDGTPIRHVAIKILIAVALAPYPGSPSAFVADFRNYYGPTMNAVAAAEQSGKAADLQQEMEALFERQNRSEAKGATSIAATFLRVTVAL